MSENIVTYEIIENKGEKLSFSLTTLVRLYELHSDATNLYMFYVKNVGIQKTCTIYSTDSFCKKGLKWGDKRFRKAKTVLIENKFIEQIIKPHETGIKYYIKVCYLKNSLGLLPPKEVTSLEETSSETTNTVNKKLNTIDKNINSVDKKNKEILSEIFSEWNKQKIIIHQKLTPALDNVINKALEIHSSEKIVDAIRNYSKIIKSNDYFFGYKWTLQDFLKRGLSKYGTDNKKGFVQFLSANKPFVKFCRGNPPSEIDTIRKEFMPLTTEYDSRNLLDKEQNTYFGFETDRLRNSELMNEYIYDLKQGVTDFGDFCWLEEAIASILFNRKGGFDLVELQALISLWKEHKKIYKKQALRMMEKW